MISIFTEEHRLEEASHSEEGGVSSLSESEAMVDNRKNRKKKLVLIAAIALAVIAVCAGAYIAWVYAQAGKSLMDQEELASNSVSYSDKQLGEPTSLELPDNPVDFTKLLEECPDACAWLSVPGTNVDLAVMQSPTDDSFYLDHAPDKSYSASGSAFIELQSAGDFTDDVTLVYGHSPVGGAMFSTLHSFRDKAFFDEHDTFYVYTPGHIYTYQIVSAYLYDNRHILNSFDFSNQETLRKYFDFVVAPTSMTSNVREGASIEDGARIVQLSTCPDGVLSTSSRYLVTGVLIEDQATK